jgi:hypothetical protein
MIAALYVQTNGIYYGLPNVDPWDEERDARKYAGPWPVVAHPPCSRWCRLARLNESRWGTAWGEDGGCFRSALRAVRTHGGVLEHPAYSDAWASFGLPRPSRGAWQKEMFGPGWVAQVSQVAYGHRARKRTWLYAVVSGDGPPPMDWDEPEAAAWCSPGNAHTEKDIEWMAAWERLATPAPFRDALLDIARACHGP